MIPNPLAKTYGSTSQNAGPSRDSSRLRGAAIFFSEIIRMPHRTGAIAPSSKALARLMMERSAVASAQTIIELGAGTGIFTEAIVAQKAGAAKVLAIECNARFVSVLRRRFQNVHVVCGCASRVRSYATDFGFTMADCILSALPWTNFNSDAQTAMLQEIRSLLSANGRFTTVACFGPHLLPNGRRFRQSISDTFSSVKMSPIVLRNFPPAFIYECFP